MSLVFARLAQRRFYHSPRVRGEQSVVQKSINLFKSASRFVDEPADQVFKAEPGPYATRVLAENRSKMDGRIYNYLKQHLLHHCPGRVWDRVLLNRQKLGSRSTLFGRFKCRIEEVKYPRQEGVGLPSVPGVPTVCVLGRSNAGKSSLVNSLIGIKISKVKDLPGSTTEPRTFLVDGRIKLMDFPGYGFAYVQPELRAIFSSQAVFAGDRR